MQNSVNTNKITSKKFQEEFMQQLKVYINFLLNFLYIAIELMNLDYITSPSQLLYL